MTLLSHNAIENRLIQTIQRMAVTIAWTKLFAVQQVLKSKPASEFISNVDVTIVLLGYFDIYI